MQTAVYDRIALASHCSREYKWGIFIAQSYVTEFLDKFVPIKRYLHDFDATICLPPPLLDKVWVVALSYTKEYQFLCGDNFIHHSPTAEFEPILVKNKRYKATLDAYKELFGYGMNEYAWYCPIEDPVKAGLEIATADSSSNSGSTSNDQVSISADQTLQSDDLSVVKDVVQVKEVPREQRILGTATKRRTIVPFSVDVKLTSGRCFTFKVYPSTRVHRLIEAVQHHCPDIPFDDIRLIYEDWYMNRGYTLDAYSVKHGDIIYLYETQVGC